MQHDIEQLTDRRLARIVRRMQDLPGQLLFRYVDEAGETRGVESADVNAYLKEISAADFTSKDFRTWAGTVLAARALQALKGADSPTEARRNVALAIEVVLALLRARAKRDARTARRSGAGGDSLVPVLARSLAVARKRPDSKFAAHTLR